MKRPIEALADAILEEGWLTRPDRSDVTIGDLAEHFDEDIERIVDALDVTKIKRGISTYTPMPRQEDG